MLSQRRRFGHSKDVTAPPTRADTIIAPLCAGGIPFLGGLMAFIGAVLGSMVWPKPETPASDEC